MVPSNPASAGFTDVQARGVLVMTIQLVLILTAATSAFAQITAGTLSGAVTDAQGGAIPGASLVVISETQGTRIAGGVTNAEGTYAVPSLKPDVYSVEVAM